MGNECVEMRGRMFQAEAECAKVLRQEGAWWVEGVERRLASLFR